MNRTFSRSFIFLVVFLVMLAGLSAVMLFLTPEMARTENFWISFWIVLFAVILAFAYMVFHLFYGRDGTVPGPFLLGMSSTIALYCAFVFGNVMVSYYWLDMSKNSYLATHIAGFLLFVGGGGALSILSLTFREADTTASLKRSRLFVLTTRISSLADELSLCPYKNMTSEVVSRLKDLNEAIRFSDPVSRNGMGGEEHVVLIVGAVEEKGRRFMAVSSDEERQKMVEELGHLIERAFSILKTRNKEIGQNK